jgi:DNA-binding LacI/PurR family transcriptional regulator
MDRNKRPTLKTIAKLAGVSTYTVSRALGGYSDISGATAAQIRQIAREIGYTPNAYARNLSMKRTNTIGMIVPGIGADTAYNEVINSVIKAAAGKGFCVQLGSCGRDIELEKAYCRMMCENRVGALILFPVSSELSHIREICRGIVPVIFFGGKTGPDEDYSIEVDCTHSARVAVTHLYELGHRSIALFLYHPENKTIAMKREGYLAAMESYGLKPAVYMGGSSDDTYTAGFSLVKSLIGEGKLPTAIWCASDLMALGAVECLKSCGFSVPSDVSVMGHDNLFFSGVPSISLTTFTLPKEEMGLHAFNIALSHMDVPVDLQETQKTFTAKLLERGSTGLAPHTGRNLPGRKNGRSEDRQ